MKAAVIFANEDIRYADWPEPEVLPGTVKIKIRAAGICGSDIPRFASTGSYNHPKILGHEFSGIVETPAEDSKLFKKGDPVAVLPIIPCGECENCATNGQSAFHCKSYRFIGSRDDGGFAEYCAVPEKNLLRLPAINALKAGSLTEPMAVGLNVARKSGFRPGKTAIVFGSGPIGLVTGIWLKEFGANRVIMADIRQKNIETADSLGFETADLSKTDINDIAKVDYAFEAAGSGKALSNAIFLLKPEGVLTVVGRDTKDSVISLKDFETFMRKEIQLRGCWGYDVRGETDFLSDVIAKRSQQLEGLISHIITIGNAKSVIDDMCAKNFEYCKVVIEFK